MFFHVIFNKLLKKHDKQSYKYTKTESLYCIFMQTKRSEKNKLLFFTTSIFFSTFIAKLKKVREKMTYSNLKVSNQRKLSHFYHKNETF